MVLWILSLASAVGTGWLVFSRTGPADPMLHAAFLLSVAGFVACCLWALARGLSADRAAEAERRDNRPEAGTKSDRPRTG